MINYYSQIAEGDLAAHLTSRPVTRKRSPDGIEQAARSSRRTCRAARRPRRTGATCVPGGTTMDPETVDFVVLEEHVPGVRLVGQPGRTSTARPADEQVSHAAAQRRPDLLVRRPRPGRSRPDLSDCMRGSPSRPRLGSPRRRPVDVSEEGEFPDAKGMQLYARVRTRDSSVDLRVRARSHRRNWLQEVSEEDFLSQMTESLKEKAGSSSTKDVEDDAAGPPSARTPCSRPRAALGLHPADLGRGRGRRGRAVRAGGRVLNQVAGALGDLLAGLSEGRFHGCLR